MLNETYITPSELEILSDENTSYEYLKRKTTLKESTGIPNDFKNIVREAVSNLEIEDKKIIHLKFWENFSNEEIAVELGKRTSTIEKRLEEIYPKLKVLLAPEITKISF